MSISQKELKSIVKIQALFRGVLIRSVILESKKQYFELFEEIEHPNNLNDFPLQNEWIKYNHLNIPHFGFNLKEREISERKMALMEKMRILNDKLEVVNGKIIERRLELGIND